MGKGDDFTFGIIKACDQGIGLPIVAAKFNGSELGTGLFQAFNDLPGLVLGPVIHKNDFIQKIKLLPHFKERRKELFYRFFLVIKRDDYG